MSSDLTQDQIDFKKELSSSSSSYVVAMRTLESYNNASEEERSRLMNRVFESILASLANTDKRRPTIEILTFLTLHDKSNSESDLESRVSTIKDKVTNANLNMDQNDMQMAIGIQVALELIHQLPTGQLTHLWKPADYVE